MRHPDLGAALGGARFLTETRTTAHLRHTHILSRLDNGEADGLLCCVIALVTSETLRPKFKHERRALTPSASRVKGRVCSTV